MPASLADFAGRWRVERAIRDARGPDGRFRGVAVLAPDGVGLAYRETGELHLGTGQFQAERRYLWRDGQTGEIVLLFPDGRHFHSFTLVGQAEARHACGPDTYLVRYDFSRWPRWQSVWRVSGPRKDYTMTTRYTPAGPADAAE